MKRREFLTLLGGASAVPIVLPRPARAQQPAKPLVGFLNTQSSGVATPHVAGFRKGLSQTDFAEGKNVAIEYRWADGQYDRLPDLATDLVNRKSAVIVAAFFPAVLAAKKTTSTIPIVFISGLDPVKSGLVTSLNRPSGNLTGISNFNATLAAKRFELIHFVAPKARAIAVLVNPTTPSAQFMAAEGKSAAQILGLRLIVLKASTESNIGAAFEALVKEQAGALVVAGDSYFSSRFDQIATLAARLKIPVIYDRREDTVAGGLMSYGPNVVDLYRQAGVYAGKILKGIKPADLPVEQSSKFELVVNLKTARMFGIEIPTSILLRADEVIE